MFLRLYKYGLLQTTRQKMTIFWSLIFPIILGTLFHVAFGGYIEETVVFHQIPVAYVMEEGADEAFTKVLESLEQENELIKVISVDKEEAKRLLKEEKVEGIYYNLKPVPQKPAGSQEKVSDGENDGKWNVTLTVTKQEMNQSILSSVLEQYQRTIHTMKTIRVENPQGIKAAMEVINGQCEYLKEGSISDTPKNVMTDYFYALIAMNCLMGVTMGLESALNFKADLSNLAARRVVASTKRYGLLLPELAAKLTVQFLCTVFSVCYLMYAMKISLGEKFGFVLLTTLVGSMVGIFLGFFIGGIGTYNESVKEGICVSCMLLSSFLSGLMVGGMYHFLERYAPVVNRINPASLIAHALYSLNIYEGYGRYMQCMISLLLLAALLGAGGFFLIRRERYASI